MNYTQNKPQNVFNRKALFISSVGLVVAFAAITAISQTEVVNITKSDGPTSLLYVGENPDNVGIGTTTPGSKLTVAGVIESTTGGIKFPDGTTQTTASGFGIVPIGSFLPWHKSFANTPALPNGWVECNGQVLSDSDSPYDGQTIPNLNGGNRFLRGNTTSGGTGGSTTHTHTGTTGGQSGMRGDNHSMHDIYLLTGDHTHGISADGHIPPYLDVVWVMRVK